MRKILKDLSINDLNEFLSNGLTIKKILDELGYNTNGSGSYKIFKTHCMRIGFDYIQFENNRIVNLIKYNKRKKKCNEELFVINSQYNQSALRRIVKNEKLIPYECANCKNNGFWMEQKLSLQLDHINGINNDNRLVNLRWLCPNCHTQTDTYGSKRLKKDSVCECGVKKSKLSFYCKDCYKKNRVEIIKNNRLNKPNIESLNLEVELYGKAAISRKYNVSVGVINNWLSNKEETKNYGQVSIPSFNLLVEEIKNMGFVKVGLKYGVSDNTIRKWIKNYGFDPKNIKKEVGQK